MNFKKIIYEVLLNVLIFAFVLQMLRSIQLPSDLFYCAIEMLAFGFVINLYAPVLKFLTVNTNFATQTVAVAILSFGMLYLLNIIAPGFKIVDWTVDSKSFSFVTISSLSVNKYGVMAIASILTGLISSAFGELRK